VPLALARTPRAWSVPALAPALGVVGLAGAFPALAGRIDRALDRAALGALGAWWLLLAEPLADRALLLGPGQGIHPEAPAREGLSTAADAVAGTVTSGRVALLALWALAALVLPWVVRGRSLALDTVAATTWAAALASGTATLATWLGTAPPRGLVAGAIVAGIVAVVEPRYSGDEFDE
ncbi:MAG: hypothetical protein ACR2NB_02450, partial [Solirubrobacteraceae bacterium]